MKPTAVRPPAKDEVPLVVTSSDPVRLKEVAAISVTKRDGMVEVAVKTCVIFPDERRRSPPERVMPTAEERPPAVVTSTPPEKVDVPVPPPAMVVTCIRLYRWRFVENVRIVEMPIPAEPTKVPVAPVTFVYPVPRPPVES